METILQIIIITGLIICIALFTISFYVDGMRIYRKYYKINENEYKKYVKLKKVLINMTILWGILFLVFLYIVTSK